ncbi:PEP-CTERM sorting domain-containing protein [Undibacterium sp. TJN25]|uniref:PEP-CTERM sorting domain-containing protein n=1 Tax=Undibacterium sp. TJN25 TaxID=3413056 RepID=UPI003BF2AEC3
MNFLKKAIFGAATALVFSGAAFASPVNVDGVIWNAGADFTGINVTLTETIDPSSGALSGFGVITSLNGQGASSFCPGCQLTVQYSGYTPVSGGVLPSPTGNGTQIAYQGGQINIFVHHDNDLNPNDPLSLNAGNTGGDLWLTLEGHAINGVTLTGSNFFPSFLFGSGLWDVTGGAGSAYLNTNTKQDGADFSFSNTFTSFPGTPDTPSSPLFSVGSGTFQGNSIPEPGSMALVGLGLLAAGALRRRQASK